MKKNLILLSALIIVFASCQKEADFAPGGNGGGGGTVSQKLVRVGTRDGADTNTIDYGYNAAGKLIRQYITGVSSGTNFFIESKYNRNASNIITSVVIKSDQFAALGIDSIVTVVKYNSASSRYSGTVTSVTVLGFTIKDSSVYTYDASGRISESESFSSDPLTSVYSKSSKDVFTYLANGNVGNEKYYDWDNTTSSYTLSEEYTNTYDSKVNPLNLGVEGVFLGNMVYSTANNLSSYVYVDATDPSNNLTRNFTYTYNSANKPETGNSTSTPASTTIRSTYTYQ
jgi:hypothetical protein